ALRTDGILRSHASPFARARSRLAMTDPFLEAPWKAVLDDWDGDAAHGAFLEYSEKSDQLLEAAVRYRGMAGDRSRGPSADRRPVAISTLALTKLEASRAVHRRTPSTIPKLVIVVFFLASLFALIASVRAF